MLLTVALLAGMLDLLAVFAFVVLTVCEAGFDVLAGFAVIEFAAGLVDVVAGLVGVACATATAASNAIIERFLVNIVCPLTSSPARRQCHSRSAHD